MPESFLVVLCTAFLIPSTFFSTWDIEGRERGEGGREGKRGGGKKRGREEGNGGREKEKGGSRKVEKGNRGGREGGRGRKRE